MILFRLIFVLILLFNESHAKVRVINEMLKLNNNVPAALKYAGKPINPRCFSKIEINDSNTLDLTHCNSGKKDYVIKNKDVALIKEGYIGFDLIEADFHGYSYYKFFNAGNDQYWIYVINSGGDSGQFRAIYLIQRKNRTTLSIKSVVGGNRCNLGIDIISNKHKVLTYRVMLTPYDVIELPNKQQPPLKSDNNLDECAKQQLSLKSDDNLVSCATRWVGEAYYEVDTLLQSKLTHVNLGVDDKYTVFEKGQVQSCFNMLYKRYTERKEVYLNQEQLHVLADQFKKTCMHSRSKT